MADPTVEVEVGLESAAPGLEEAARNAHTDCSSVHVAHKLPTPNTMPPEISAGYVPPMQELSSISYGEHDMSGFLRGVMTPNLVFGHRDHDHSLTNWEHLGSGDGPRGLLDFTIDSLDEFDASDFGMFNQLCNDAAGITATSQWYMPSLETTAAASKPDEMPSDRRSLDKEAYKRSALGTWVPGHADYTAAELEDLAALRNDSESTESRLAAPPGVRFHGDALTRSTRDEFLAMILRSCKPERSHFVLSAFPTAELLHDLVRSFFSLHVLQPDSWFHLPTFRMNEQKPQLLAVLVASGAISTDIKSLHKLGFALQEAVRTALPTVFDEANTNARMLWALQTMLCEIEIGLWSGIKRKMELSESHTQIVYTPCEEDIGETLQRKWRLWVEEESWKRLAFHAFIVDAQTSMAMFTSPVIAFSELSIPLPELGDLWLAETAEKWKEAYMRQTEFHPDHYELKKVQTTQTLIDHLRQPREIASVHDSAFSQLIILHGFWGMASQHLQLSSILTSTPGHSSAAVALRRQELLQSLQNFEISSGPLHSEAQLVLELIQMRLHVAMEDIELFAGKGSLDAARRVVPALQQWAASQPSRQALWHAGQVIRAANTFSTNSKQLRGFYTIGVLHASLVMWAYSILVVGDAESAGSDVDGHVCLDGPESPAMRRFITLGKGIPCLTCSSGLSTPAGVMAPLSDQETAMTIVLETLGGGFHSKSFDEVNPEHKSAHSAWETPDPGFWTSHGYAVVRADERGIGQSRGRLDTMSRGTSEAFAEVVEWCSAQSWSTGKVGLLGISYYAGSQWRVAAQKPKGLAAMIPWEGMADYYRDRCRHGGILSNNFIDFWWNRQVVANQYGRPRDEAITLTKGTDGAGPMRPLTAPESLEGNLSSTEREESRQDQTIDNRTHQFRDQEYYASKEYDLSDIEVPMLSVANWGGILLHLRGNVEGYLHAGSEKKWLRFITGRHDLPFYYKEEVNVQLSFLDAFLKGEDRAGWTTGKVPPVDLVLRRGDVGFNNPEGERTFPRRSENEWPISRTQWTRLYLTPAGILTHSIDEARRASPRPSKHTYEALGKIENPRMIQFSTNPVDETTEITGNLVAHLCVSASPQRGGPTPSDIDLFITIRHISATGNEVLYTGTAGDAVPLTKGWLRVSMRKINARHPKHREHLPWREYLSTDQLPVIVGEKYEVDVEVWPTSVVLEKGARLVLEISSGDTQGAGIFLHNDPVDR
ncbi:hypothetical protein ACHAQA_006163 [Verticillium albo-atrum]